MYGTVVITDPSGKWMTVVDSAPKGTLLTQPNRSDLSSNMSRNWSAHLKALSIVGILPVWRWNPLTTMKGVWWWRSVGVRVG